MLQASTVLFDEKPGVSNTFSELALLLAALIAFITSYQHQHQHRLRPHDMPFGSSGCGYRNHRYDSYENPWAYEPPDDEYDSGSEGSIRVAGEVKGSISALGAAIAAAPSQLKNFSMGGPADLLPAQPGLIIKGVGPVLLPVMDQAKANAIAAVSEQATRPGHGASTTIDKQVRSSWEIGADKITIENPRWQTGILMITHLIAEKMGLPDVPITMQLHKLLLSQKGNHVPKHRATDKPDGAFATVVVELPSKHEGGHLLVYKGKEDKPVKHDFGDAARTKAFQCHFAMHFADAEHASTPITSGYRVALVYAVCWPKDNKDPAPSTKDDDDIVRISKALQPVAKERRQFYYILEVDYDDESLSQSEAVALQGRDRERVSVLQAANAKLPAAEQYVFFLGTAERHARYRADPYNWDDADWQYQYSDVSIKHLSTQDGKQIKVTKAQKLRDENILNPDKKTTGQLWRGERLIEYGGEPRYDGPERETKTTKCILVAVPKGSAVMTLLGEAAAYSQLTKTTPSVKQVEQFLEEIRTRASDDDDDGRPNQQQLDVRRKLLDYVVKNPAFAKGLLPDPPSARSALLGGPYVDSSGGILPLAPPTAAANAETIPFDRTALVKSVVTAPALWSQPAIQSYLVGLFEKDEQSTISVVLGFLDDGLDASVWTVFRQALERCLADDKATTGPYDYLYGYGTPNVSKDLWAAAVRVPESTLCDLVVKRQLKKMSSLSLKGTVSDLVALLNKYPQHLHSRIKSLEPLFRARMKAIREERDALDLKRDGWRMPHANASLEARLLDFLRGPQQMTQFFGFTRITGARTLASSWNSSWMQTGCSFTATEGGKAANSYVTVTKTETYFQQVAAQHAALNKELSKLKTLLRAIAPAAAAGPLAAQTSGKHAMTAPKGGETEAKRPRIS
ncbi:hypothetical protein V8E36_005221 [Tilletia maclaganii]